MIPYDDLVSALQSWRASQGLPVGNGAPVAAAATPGSGPRTAPPIPRSNPPAPPRTTGSQLPLAAPPATMDDALDVDESALVDEEVYENEGADFAMAFAASDSEATQIGGDPEEIPAAAPPPPPRDPNREDW